MAFNLNIKCALHVKNQNERTNITIYALWNTNTKYTFFSQLVAEAFWFNF